MPANDPSTAFHAPGVFRLLRSGCLVDGDLDGEGDSLADIERWGSGVAWAPDHTIIAR